jgi:hypothetical protein
VGIGVAESNRLRKIIHMEQNSIDFSFSPENMYLWGYLWSDGYFLDSRKLVSLEIQEEDFANIEHLIPYYYNVSSRARENRKPTGLASSTREDLFKFFMSNGYEYKDCPSTKITKSQNNHYWFRGLIDGDGCWYIGKCKQFTITSNLFQDWKFFTDMLDNIGVKKYSVRRQPTEHVGSSYVRICNKKGLHKLYDFLYPAGYDFGLRRKFDKAEEIKAL